MLMRWHNRADVSSRHRHPSTAEVIMQHYPTSGAPVEQQRGPAPSSVLNAVKLMYAGAAITTVAIIVSLLTIDSTRTAVRKANDHSTLTAHQITQLANFVIVAGVVSSFIAIGLWLWMAWKTGQGRGWARIVSSVLFALCTLDQLSLLKAGVAIGTIFEVVTWLVGLGAIVLLWQRSSSEYFRPRALL
jgi:hypothetical protein